LKVACKIWLDHKGKAFGEGPYKLLNQVKKTCSLHRAANEMEMSYSKAWKLIQVLEKRLGFPLLAKRVGGRSGGGSEVTPRAQEFMRRYGRFEREAKRSLEKIYGKHFGSFIGET
jgi:molybdate transport system regulatory protein